VSDILFSSATAAAGMVRRREVSAIELTRALLARIDAVDPAVNAVVELRRDAALREAAAADRALRRSDPGPLHGVPMTVKEAFDVAGMHSTWGHPAFRDWLAGSDATVVRRLREAGVVVVGTTNVHVMLADFGRTANDLYGVTGNPWDLTRTPGGSGGGGAAALAAGMTFLEYGSDLAGSIRIPAALCGVYGLRPTPGIVPLTGFQPPDAPRAPGEPMSMSAIGPLARSAADLRTALRVTAGPEAPAANRRSVPPPRHGRLRDFRVGVVLDDDRAPVTSEVGTRLADVVDALVRRGAAVVEGWPEGVDPVRSAEAFGFHVELFLASQDPDQSVARSSEIPSRERERAAVRAAWGRYFEHVDVFLCPASFTGLSPRRPPVRAAHDRDARGRAGLRRPHLLDRPRVARRAAERRRAGREDARRLPVGVQIVGPAGEDDTPITFAALLAEVAGGYEPPPL